MSVSGFLKYCFTCVGFIAAGLLIAHIAEMSKTEAFFFVYGAWVVGFFVGYYLVARKAA